MLKNLKIRTKLLISFLAMSIIPFLVIGIVSLMNSSRALSSLAFGQLESIRELKKAQIDNFFSERENDMGILMETVASLRQAAFEKLSSVQESKKSQIREHYNDILSDITVISRNSTVLKALNDFASVLDEDGSFDHELYRFFEDVKYGDSLRQYPIEYGYYDLLLITKEGNVVYSVSAERDLGANLLAGPLTSSGLGRCFRKGLLGLNIQDYEPYAPSGNQYISFLGAPIVDKFGNVSGVVVIKIDVSAINTIVQRRRGMGETGETFLVGVEDGKTVYRSDRIIKTGHFGSEISDRIITQAVLGTFGSGINIGSTGTMEIFYHDHLEILGLDWVIITTMGLEEVIAPKLKGEPENYFTKFVNAYGYADLLLITPGGDVFYSVVRSQDYGANLISGDAADSGLGKLFHKVLESQSFVFVDFMPYLPAGGEPRAFIGQPVVRSGNIELVVALQLSPDTINRVMQERSGMGKTGETYLLGPDSILRSQSFLGSESDSVAIDSVNPKKGIIDTPASRAALSGTAGEKIIPNYSGKQVLSAFSPLTVWDTTWALIAEMDVAEAFSSVKVLRYVMGLVALIGITAIVVISFLVARRISEPINRLTNFTEEISDGKFDAALDHTLIESRDEIGMLANSFNTMTGRLKESMEELREEIAEHAQAESALRESEEKYRLLVENAPLGILSMDPEGRIIEANTMLMKTLGASSADDMRTVNLLTFPPLIEAGIADDFRNCLETGKPGISERPYISRWDTAVYLRYHLTPIRSGEDRIIGVQAIVEDISEQRNLEAQLFQAQKLESIGTLAGGIAHDFNNILSPIIGHTELALMEVPSDDPLKFNLEEVFQAANRAKDLVAQILTFSRQREHKHSHIRISPLVKEALKLLRSTIPTTIDIKQDIKIGSDIVYADGTQIHQILMNLCTNAAHAMRDKNGTIEVSLVDEHLDSGNVGRYSNLSPGNYLRLTVRDTGHGIAPEIMDRIFEPYFTTKRHGEGTGMGLAVVHGIIKGHGGEITVDSKPGAGTAFHVLLPKIDKAVRTEKEPKAKLPTGTERLFFVDDEKAAVNTIGMMMERLGYRVEARTSSVEALEAFRNKPDAFDLIITDMTMPNMTGVDLAKEMMKIRHDIPIILCTGYSEAIDEETAKEMGIKEFIMKPILMKDLAAIIRKVLDSE